MDLNLIISLDELKTTYKSNFFYYCLWCYITTTKQSYYLSKDKTKKSFTMHSTIDKSAAKEWASCMSWRVLRDHLSEFKEYTVEEKEGDLLIVVPFPILAYVINIVINSGAPVGSWSNYLRVWVYYWLACKGDQEQEVSQPVAARIIDMRYQTFNEITQKLIQFGLIERSGNYTYGGGIVNSHSYSYKIPQFIRDLSQNDWNLE